MSDESTTVERCGEKRTIAQAVTEVLATPTPAGADLTEVNARKLDFLQFQLGQLPQLDMPLTHRFTPGLYIREIFMPKGAIVISRVHKREHPFVVSKGKVAVWSENDGWQFIKAPFTGITTPGTRRILFISEDCIWTTFHCGDWPADTDPDVIVGEVTETPDVSYIGEMQQKVRELTAYQEEMT